MTSGVPVKMDEMDILKARFITFLAETPGCTISAAAMEIGISRSLAYQWRQMDADFNSAVAWAQKVNKEITKDFVEHKLMTLVGQGNVAAILFATRCLLRDRGYIEKGPPKSEPAQANKIIHFTVVAKPYAKQPDFTDIDVPPPPPVPQRD